MGIEQLNRLLRTQCIGLGQRNKSGSYRCMGGKYSHESDEICLGENTEWGLRELLHWMAGEKKNELQKRLRWQDGLWKYQILLFLTFIFPFPLILR